MLTEVFIPVHKAGLQQIFRNYDAYNIFCSFFTERLYLESSVAWGIFKTWAISRCFIPAAAYKSTICRSVSFN